MQKIAPFLWFNANAEEAVNYYVSVFKDAKIITQSRYGGAGLGPKGSVMTIEFELKGQRFLALNGGPTFTFTPAISFVVNCETQDEIDYYWDKLSAGGKEVECGWVQDKFGLSWQVVPTIIGKIVGENDPAKTNRMMQAVLKMKRLNIAELERAANG